MQHPHDAPCEDTENALATWIGGQIRELRLRKGWSQRRLARDAGIAQQNLSLYERGLASPRLGTLGRLLRALGARLHLELAADQTGIEPTIPGPSREALMGYVDRQVARALEEEQGQRRSSEEAEKAG